MPCMWFWAADVFPHFVAFGPQVKTSIESALQSGAAAAVVSWNGLLLVLVVRCQSGSAGIGIFRHGTLLAISNQVCGFWHFSVLVQWASTVGALPAPAGEACFGPAITTVSLLPGEPACPRLLA